MRTQCAVAIIAVVVVVLFSVLMVVPTVMSMSDEDYRYFRFTGNVTELWNQSHEGASWTSASAVRDLDGDGKEDVLVLTSVNNEATNTTIETVIAKRGYDGTHLWEENVTVGPSGDGIDAYPAGDLDGDGKEDVLVQMTEYNETTNTTTMTVIAKLGCNGTQLWEKSVTGSSSVISATEAIAPYVKEGNIVILESTSPVGTTDKVAEVLEGKGIDITKVHVAHCPERVLPGQIMRELVENDRIVGGINEASTKAAAEFYKNFVSGAVLETDAKTAEMAKLTENAFRDTNIAFANELSIEWDEEHTL